MGRVERRLQGGLAQAWDAFLAPESLAVPCVVSALCAGMGQGVGGQGAALWTFWSRGCCPYWEVCCSQSSTSSLLPGGALRGEHVDREAVTGWGRAACLSPPSEPRPAPEALWGPVIGPTYPRTRSGRIRRDIFLVTRQLW